MIGRRSRIGLAVVALSVSVSGFAAGQQKTAPKLTRKEKIAADTTPYKPTALFSSNRPLEATLTLNLRQIKKDRKEEAPWRAAALAYKGADGATVEIPARVRTRGIWRMKNCDIPPLRMDFAKDKVKRSEFAGQDRVKLVLACHNNDKYEGLLLDELQLYRIYQLLTPISHRVRLVRLTVTDSGTQKLEMTRWAFFVEDEAETTKRNGGRMYDVTGATSTDLEPQTAAIVGLFQYLIGNTDYSVPVLHNVELMARDTSVYPVAYDFDFAGVVNAPYAIPDYRLPIKRVTQRLFRGPCAPANYYPAVIDLFKSRRDSIAALYRDDVGRLIPPGRVKETLEYFDDFYKTIGDARMFKREILEACSGLS
jgi:hypothetical protein